ncbi:MAG TPA: nuclear transport factor 2 family protein [Ktedonobacteraceae bacterium]|nr:nuclear transport factor 2 family protein [Ktedonobacteraceae bacterium]
MQIQENEKQVSLHRTVVNQWIEAFNGHNVPAIVSLYTEDAELYDSGMKHPRRGRAEIEQWFTTRFQTMPSITYTSASQLFTETQAAVTWTVRGRGPRLLGQSWLVRPLQVHGVSVFYLVNGQIQQQRGYYDHLSALEQILPPLKGLLPRL